MKTKQIVFGIALVTIAATAFGQTTITKPPDVGPYWQTVSPTGSYVYADSFIAPATDVYPQVLGTWLNDYAAGSPGIRFEIWGDLGGGLGPDAGNVLVTTGSLSPPAFPSLTYYEMPVLGPPPALTTGEIYWFVATCVGESGTGAYQVGGHTQNSVYMDNGTFWFSNDVTGVVFDGQNYTPEMAFSVSLTPDVPVELMSFTVN